MPFTSVESECITALGRDILNLFETRYDIIIGFAAVLFDLYRVNFQAGLDTKALALSRLGAQLDEIKQKDPKARGAVMLECLIESLKTDRLNAAMLLREVPAGSA